MIVVGGCYAEVCAFPDWNRIFGSGLRAAVALSELHRPVCLHSYVPSEWMADVRATLATFEIDGKLTLSDAGITFAYLTPLDKCGYAPFPPPRHDALNVSGPAVLQFGMLEGGAIVDADYAVFDPQAGGDYATFGARGSHANHLAVVLSEEEFAWKQEANFDRQARARKILDAERGAEVIVVKTPFGGASVYVGDQMGQDVPAYQSTRYFKIGTGDVFSAAFAWAWAVKKLDPRSAADFASRCAGYYADGAQLPLPADSHTLQSLKARSGKRAKVSLAGNGATLAQHTLILSAYDHLSSNFRVEAALPELQEAAMLRPRMAGADTILGILEADASNVDQLIDHAAIGQQRLVLLISDAVPAELSQRLGGNLVVTDDFTTAVYRAAFKEQ